MSQFPIYLAPQILNPLTTRLREKDAPIVSLRADT
jgi:hypothetical protein